MAGGVPNRGREYRSLAERGVIRMPSPAPSTPSRSSPGPSAGRHVWVLTGDDARVPGLLTQWRREHPAPAAGAGGPSGRRDGGWAALVVYVADVDGQPALVQAWVPADRLRPADTR